MNRSTITMAVLFAVSVCASGCTSESDSSDGAWEPDGNVEIMVTGSPGGGSDTMARVLDGEIGTIKDGVSAVVENYDPIEAYTILKGEAGNPDRLMTTNYGGAVLIPQTQGLDYSYEDFTPIAVVGVDNAYLVTAEGGYSSMDELIDDAEGGGVTVGQVAGGGQNTVLTQQLEEALGVTFEPVVFEGGGEQVAATLAGDVDFSIMEPAEFIGQAESGDILPLMVLGDQPPETGILAEVPTPDEFDLDVEFVTQWRGFFAAADLSESQVAWWRELVEDWAETEAYQEYMTSNFIVPELLVGDELEDFLAESVGDSEGFGE